MELFNTLKEKYGTEFNVNYDILAKRYSIFSKAEESSDYSLIVYTTDISTFCLSYLIGECETRIGEYYSSEELFREIERQINRIEIVFFVEENGLPEMIKHTSSLNVYDEDCANIRKMYEQQGINVIAVEFYSLFNLLPKLVADKTTYGYVMRLMGRKFKELKNLFPQGVEEKIYPDSGESINREDAITEDNPFESSNLTIFIYKPNKNPERLSIDSYNCALGYLYCSIYVFPYDQFFIFFCDKDTFSTLEERLKVIHKELFKD